MKNCKDIENSLPLYSEGVLSDAEKQAVEEHLAGCAECRKELAYLRKTSQLVDNLSAVEEPPWFQQKIMARVREEAQKKSFAQKWFYPLRIKIPVQIMATIVIAILAVYIYRSGDDQVKQILPGAPRPAMEMQKEQAPAQMPQSTDRAEPAVTREKATVREEVKQGKQVMGNIAAGSSAQKSDVPESKSKAAYDADAYKAKGFAESKDEANAAFQAKPNEIESAQSQIAEPEKKANDYSLPAMAKKRESNKMAAPAAPGSMGASIAVPPQASVLLRVDDLDAAAAQVEKILTKYDARIKSRKLLEGTVVLQAEVSGTSLKDVLSKLKGIGSMEEKVIPAGVHERDITVVIEIKNQ